MAKSELISAQSPDWEEVLEVLSGALKLGETPAKHFCILIFRDKPPTVTFCVNSFPVLFPWFVLREFLHLVLE